MRCELSLQYANQLLSKFAEYLVILSSDIACNFLTLYSIKRRTIIDATTRES